MTHWHRTIHIEPLAPPKPRPGAPCNGCGVCCLVQPCPVGMVLSGRRTGSCVALRWNERAAVYRCGAIDQPVRVMAAFFPARLHAAAALLAPALRVLARHAIARDTGCDCELEVNPEGQRPRS